MRRLIAALLIFIPIWGYGQSAKYILDSNDVVTPEFLTPSNSSILATGITPLLTNTFLATNYFNSYISEFLDSTNALSARTSLGLSGTWLTNTTVANFNAAIGLGTVDAPTFSGLTIADLEIDGNGSINWGGDLKYEPESQTFFGGITVSGAITISENTSGQATANRAITRTNLGLPWSGLTNNSASTFQVALFNTNPLNAQGQRITNLATPVDDSDAATKAYVFSLFNRTAPSVSFGNNVGTVEIGSTVTAVTLSWSISPTNTPVSSQTLTPFGSISTSLRSTNVTGTFTSDTNWTLVVNDGTGLPGGVVTASTGIAFRHYMSWGIASSTNLNNSQIQNLHTNIAAGAGREFRTGKGKSVSITGNGQYIYFAYPSTFGAASFIVNNAPNTAWISNTVTYTNSSGNVSQFLIYRSTDVQFGTSIPITIN